MFCSLKLHSRVSQLRDSRQGGNFYSFYCALCGLPPQEVSASGKLQCLAALLSCDPRILCWTCWTSLGGSSTGDLPSPTTVHCFVVDGRAVSWEAVPRSLHKIQRRLRQGLESGSVSKSSTVCVCMGGVAVWAHSAALGPSAFAQTRR